MNDRDVAYLHDMLDAAREAMSFAKGQDLGALESDRKLALALVQAVTEDLPMLVAELETLLS